MLFRTASLCVLFCWFAALQPSLAQDEAALFGRKPLPLYEGGYRQAWAVVIGINYDDPRKGPKRSAEDRLVLPRLNNAQNDATELKKLLIEKYGYKEANVEFLIHEDATKDRIESALGKILDAERVAEQDSVFVFFAGHGARVSGFSDKVAIYPYDVKFSGGRPIEKEIGLHSGLLDKLSRSPAKHKLLILDSCYSGEIFNINAKPRSEVDDRTASALFEKKCIQAITSSRSFQTASDGTGVTSPFTTELLKGLQWLPAVDPPGEPQPVTTNRLFSFMRPRLKRLVGGQSPDCRNFNIPGDEGGEFHFFPDPGADFTAGADLAAEQLMLQAAVTSENGQWWFTEMPWFIPGIRKQLLARLEPSRGRGRWIEPQRLRELAEELVEKSPPKNNDAKELDARQLRIRHAQRLLHAKSDATSDLKKIFEDIHAELEAAREKLQPEDLHFLAVVQHALGDAKAGATFQEVLKKHQPASDEDKADFAKDVMRALCLADYGQHLSSKPRPTRREITQAAQRFREADDTLRFKAPASFRVFVLCREASAWLSLNQWADANLALQDALDAARLFDPRHPLMAHVHRQRAWALMIQWRIAEAELSFAKSNEILGDLLRLNTAEARPGDSGGNQRPKLDAAKAADAPASVAGALDDCSDVFCVDELIRNSTEYNSKIAYLHNLHGLAMAKRFQGRTRLAAAKYRWLTGELQDALDRLRSQRNVRADVETQLLHRFVNTQERLGDCNLFGDPSQRDPKEAADDYRRALGRVHLLPEKDRPRWRAVLLYKQALALSLPSPVQDSSLAMAMCAEADDIFKPNEEAATGLSLVLGKLSTPVVTLIHANSPPAARPGRAPDGPPSQQAALAALREALREFRSKEGPNFHRDQLELCLLAGKTLLEYGHEQNIFRLNQDVDLLLSFCRTALSPHQRGADSAQGPTAGESSGYLRPYYDAAMSAKLGVNPPDVKALLEIQWEATHGRPFVKPETASPTLATYLLNGECFLLMDLPRGASRCVRMAHYDVAAVQTASKSAEERLTLPREIAEEMTAWLPAERRGGKSTAVHCYWIDPVRNVGQAPANVNGRSVGKTESVFPFKLPSGFTSFGGVL